MEDLPPGFRFYPTEEELVSFYLHNKLEGNRPDLNRIMDRIIPVLDIYNHNPCQLPQLGGDLSNRDEEQWFFFVPRQESEARGGRPNRLTTNGYWKATGSPGNIYSNNRIIGMKRTMVFYRGRAPNGIKTDWKMNEYKSIIQSADINASSSSSSSSALMIRHELSLCRVYKKSKSARAYDRRPLGEIRSQPDHDEATPSDLHQNYLPSSSAQDAPNSPLSSSPHDLSQENTTLPMSIDSEPFWDNWDEFDF
ncbi:NAC domain-containing protein 90-like [Euphorbia lathyris]|uniref:NAC domain-containing protein 90-like n=1 Tax=Euphorbia lathyris TaxID=212925 RepID=UPI003313B3B7